MELQFRVWAQGFGLSEVRGSGFRVLGVGSYSVFRVGVGSVRVKLGALRPKAHLQIVSWQCASQVSGIEKSSRSIDTDSRTLSARGWALRAINHVTPIDGISHNLRV